jgi:hypothetical protein
MELQVSPLRRNILRCGYLMLAALLGPMVWTELLGPVGSMSLQRSVVVAMLCALSGLSLLGLLYPLRMLPLLFFEMAWKAIWLVGVALRLALARSLDAAATETTFECLVVVVIVAITPWDYVLKTLVGRSPEAWRLARDARPSRNPAFR